MSKNRKILFALLVGWIISSASVAEQNNQMRTKSIDSIYMLYAVKKDKKTVVASGSSVAIGPHDLVTNCHVALAGDFLVADVDNKLYLTHISYHNKSNDLCLIHIPNVNLRPVHIRAGYSVNIGDEVYAVSNLHSKGKTITKGTVTNILSEDGTRFLEASAVLTKGSSGGGLFDKDGHLIGITTKGVPDTEIGYSLSTDVILEIVERSRLPSCKIPTHKVLHKNK